MNRRLIYLGTNDGHHYAIVNGELTMLAEPPSNCMRTLFGGDREQRGNDIASVVDTMLQYRNPYTRMYTLLDVNRKCIVLLGKDVEVLGVDGSRFSKAIAISRFEVEIPLSDHRAYVKHWEATVTPAWRGVFRDDILGWRAHGADGEVYIDHPNLGSNGEMCLGNANSLFNGSITPLVYEGLLSAIYQVMQFPGLLSGFRHTFGGMTARAIDAAAHDRGITHARRSIQ